jgi:hypothetical protein
LAEKVLESPELSLEAQETSKVTALDKPDTVAIMLGETVLLTTLI